MRGFRSFSRRANFSPARARLWLWTRIRGPRGRNDAEIAETLNRNLNTVKYQFYRAHTGVRQELQSEVAQS